MYDNFNNFTILSIFCGVVLKRCSRNKLAEFVHHQLILMNMLVSIIACIITFFSFLGRAPRKRKKKELFSDGIFISKGLICFI